MITNSGLHMLQFLMLSGTTARITHMAFGSGTVNPTVSDTQLGGEYFRGTAGFSNLGSPLVGDTYSGLIYSTSSYDLGSFFEVGLLSSGAGGQLFSRALYQGYLFDNGSDWMTQWDVIQV